MNIAAVMRTLNKNAHLFKKPIITEISELRRDPYIVLVSCILSLRTKDETTDAASARLVKLAQTPEEMIKLSEVKIIKAILPVGFYKTKSEN